MSHGFDVYLRKCVERGQPIFPEKFCVGPDPEKKKTDLDQLRISQGSFHFSAQMNNDPVDEDAVEFKRHWIRRYEGEPPPGDDYLFVDPAFTLKQTNDFSGLIVSRVTTDNLVYVMEALKLKVDANGLISEIFRLHRLYPKIIKTLVESVAAQVMLLTLLRAEMIKQNKFFSIEEYLTSNKEKKAVRIRGLVPRYASGGILHRQGLLELEAELLEFPRNTHDDLIDALSQGTTIWKPPSKAHDHSEKVGTFDWWKRNHLKREPLGVMQIGGGLFRDLFPYAK